MAADGSITAVVDIDDKEAQRQLDKLKKSIESLEHDTKVKEATKSRLEAELEEVSNAYTQAMHSGDAALQKTLEKQVNALGSRIDKLTESIKENGDSAEVLREEYGALQKELAGVGNAGEEAGNQTSAAMKQMTSRLEKFEKRVIGLAKRVFFFSLITSGLRSLRNSLWDTIRMDDEATATIARLKGALLTLVQPIIQQVIPAFTSLVNVLAQAAAFLANIVAVLFGTTGKKAAEAAENLNDEKKALAATGKAAQKAAKQLAPFDEINKLVADTAAGAAGAVAKTIDPDFTGIGQLSEWQTDLLLKIKDVQARWSDFSEEGIARKILAAVFGVAGGIIGWTLGGPLGAIVGLSLGALLSTIISDAIFDFDGKLSGEEIASLIMMAVFGLAGGIIGWAIGGPFGAAVGLTLGALLGFTISELTFDYDGNLSDEEILSALMVAAFGVAGGIIGWAIGGPIGAAVGLIVGAALGLGLKSLLFNNDGKLTPEEIGKALISTLLTIAGGIIGFTFGGGIPGAAIGASVGAGLAILLMSTAFEGEGSLKQRLLETLIDALSMIAGGLLGFVLTGANPIGAVVGVSVGAGLSLLIKEALFGDGESSLKDTLMKSLLTMLAGIAGAMIGFALGGGPAGAALGATIGVGVTLVAKDVSWGKLELIREKAKEWGNNLLSGVKDKLRIGSPSKEFEEIGEYALAGLANGMKDTKALAQSFDTMMSQMSASAQNSAKQMEASFDAATKTTESTFKSAADRTTTLIKKVLNYWQRAMQSALETSRSVTSSMAAMFSNMAAQSVAAIQSIISALNSIPRNVTTTHTIITESAGSVGDTGGTRVSSSTAVKAAASRLTIPALAAGSVIPPNREFLAVLGDQKSGTNIEAPLDTIVQAFRQALNEQGGGRQQTIILELDRRQFGKVTFDAYNLESQRVGVKLGG